MYLMTFKKSRSFLYSQSLTAIYSKWNIANFCLLLLDKCLIFSHCYLIFPFVFYIKIVIKLQFCQMLIKQLKHDNFFRIKSCTAPKNS